jgi:putative addiction module component (TIGR02574 family)
MVAKLVSSAVALEPGARGGAFRMDPDVSSVFDLTPSEKLQLVEDLWDDLASTPEAIPVHNWQKEELDRRKANLLQAPDSGLTWAEVQRRVRSHYGR